jgi:hypothetical protein
VSGGSLNVAANNTNGNASYLKSNGSSLDTKPATANYTYNHTNITSNQNYELEVTQAGTTVVKKFTVIVNPDCFSYNAYRFIRRNQL